MPKIQRIVIHCTATPERREVSKDEIQVWHLAPPPKGRGWKHYGYHLLVHLDGSISELQPLPKTLMMTPEFYANGAVGYNSTSIHVAYVGGLQLGTNAPKDTRTQRQRIALFRIIKKLRSIYGNLPVLGHRDLPGVRKACPCFDARKEYNNV